MTRTSGWPYLILSFLAGTLLSLQARINSFVSTDLGDSFAAAAFVFITGGVTVAVVVVANKNSRRSVGLAWTQFRTGALPWHLLLGGVGGVMGILAQTTAVQVIGVALFSLSFVVGQMVSSSAIDHFGWSLGLRRKLTCVGVGALIVALAGVVMASGSGLDVTRPEALGALALVFVAGLGVSAHMAFNGRVTTVVGRPEASVLATYIAGTAVLVLVSVVLLLTGTGNLRALANVRPWYVALGIIGPAIVMVSAIIVRHIGPLLFTLGMVTGQLLGSIVLDVAWPVDEPILPAWSTIMGALLALCGLVVLQRWGQRPVVAVAARKTSHANVHRITPSG
ncbi:DMT family transporter [Citricoccus parietis]|uniref:DMT family transporter n=2 Tax=Citricoccus parietis TaxID=592307 RepID=A0ABV6F8L0_9MICC